MDYFLPITIQHFGRYLPLVVLILRIFLISAFFIETPHHFGSSYNKGIYLALMQNVAGREVVNQERIRVIDDEMIAYNNRDLDRFCSFYHPDAQISVLDGALVASGMNEIREVYKIFFEKFPNIHCELKSRIVVNDTIIDEENISGRPDYPEGQHGVVIYKFQGNLISRVWFV